ncbi:GNAT family N-acetyltransferase [Geobacter sp.]|uniref:GNAT family N-acetyltransferase n=1 Tax=Geobacter sp. TaxID=46610 RepID=UPI0027B9A4C1|nr:GNAT family N-acetyltransferase [Geobacter sp.]
MADDGAICNLSDFPHWESLLDQLYVELYLPAFAHPAEVETPPIWKPLLGPEKPDSPAPLLTIFLAGEGLASPDPTSRWIDGFIFAELYRESGCGLLTYLAVRPEARRRGVGRRLVTRAVEHLNRLACDYGGRLRAVFVESEDPLNPDNAAYHDRFDLFDRITVLERLGARRVVTGYVQPPLTPHQERARNLLLFAIPIDGILPRQLDAEVLRDFLHEFYRAEGIDPETDGDVTAMIPAGKDGEIPPLDLQQICVEQPTLAFGEFGIAFHFMGSAQEKPSLAWEESDQNFASFERDLLSHTYRAVSPMANRTVETPKACCTVDVLFPDSIRYEAEGFEKLLLLRRHSPDHHGRRLAMQVRRSRTMFRDGTCVFHLVLSPPPPPLPCDEKAGERTGINEWDLVKLAKLWEGGEGTGRGEECDISPAIRFAAGGEELTIDQLAGKLFGKTDLTLMCGTLQLLSGPAATGWPELWDALILLRESGDVSLDTGLMPRVRGIGGIVQGLLDFPYIDDSELHDVLGYLDLREGSLIGFHKGTLVYVCEECRAYRAVHESVGISPYLTLPHAVLIYNGTQLEIAHGRSLRADGVKTRELQTIELAMREALQKKYLPNLFFYPTERFLFIQGHASRGMDDRKASLERALLDIQGKLAERRADRDSRFERSFLVVGTLLAAVQTLSIIGMLFPKETEKYGDDLRRLYPNMPVVMAEVMLVLIAILVILFIGIQALEWWQRRRG